MQGDIVPFGLSRLGLVARPRRDFLALLGTLSRWGDIANLPTPIPRIGWSTRLLPYKKTQIRGEFGPATLPIRAYLYTPLQINTGTLVRKNDVKTMLNGKSALYRGGNVLFDWNLALKYEMACRRPKVAMRPDRRPNGAFALRQKAEESRCDLFWTKQSHP